ncbi:hypothetical protein [Candidatus Hodgkinia cicadicola]|uniref:hypothetical protein n=1 Tax=Candidatus Hodgkinia cicadicola TaxID=573658 RepID=UPI001788DF2B
MFNYVITSNIYQRYQIGLRQGWREIYSMVTTEILDSNEYAFGSSFVVIETDRCFCIEEIN